MRRQAAVIMLSDKVRHILRAFQQGTHSALHLQQRATIVLLAADGISNRAIARQTGWNRNTVKQWRNRWAAAAAEVAVQEKDRPWGLNACVTTVLQDAYRSAKPGTFTPEPVAHIVALACDPPQDHDVPLSHWTASALAREAIHQKIVTCISPRHVGRFLKGGRSETAPEPLLAESSH